MRHIQGFEVLLENDGEPYVETLVPEDRSLWLTFYDENTTLQGRFNTPISQVAINKDSTDLRATGRFDLHIWFYSNFNFHSANAVQVNVCMKEGQVLKKWSTVLWKTDFANDYFSYTLYRKGIKLPVPWKNGAKGSKTWKRRFSADPGSVTVFVSRGKADEMYKDSINRRPTAFISADVVPGTADEMNRKAVVSFKKLRKPYGETYCFEFQVHPQGMSSVLLWQSRFTSVLAKRIARIQVSSTG